MQKVLNLEKSHYEIDNDKTNQVSGIYDAAVHAPAAGVPYRYGR